MAHPDSQRLIRGTCPNCGPSRISILLEGSCHFNSTPNFWCSTLIGRCHGCGSHLETYFDDEESEKLEWAVVDEEKVEFLFGPISPPRSDPEDHP